MTLPPISRQTVATVLASAWAILWGGLRIFGWDSLKEGFIDVRPLPRTARLLTVMGLALVFVFVASILFNDTLRWSGELESLPLESSGTRGIFVPSTAVPIAYLATILAWTFLLTGALHVMGLVRWSVLFFFLIFGLPGLIAGAISGIGADRPELFITLVGLILAALLGLVLSLLILPRQRLPLALEFVVMLALVGGLYILGLYAAVGATRLSGINLVSGYLVPDAVTESRTLIIPLLILAGAETINFGVSLSGWGTQSARRFAPEWVVLALLITLLASRWISFVVYDVLPGVTDDQLGQWAGALLAGIVLIPVALWRARKPFPDRVPLKLVLGLIVSMVLPQFLLFFVIDIASAYFSAQVGSSTAAADLNRLGDALISWSEQARDAVYLVLALAGGITAVIAMRRKRYTVAAYGMILGWTQLVWWFMENGRPLQEWRYGYGDMEPWLLLALTGLTIYLNARGELTPPRALALLGLVFFAWVLNFTDFLDNPLSLFFGFAGLFFTAFGILWGVLTAGGKFANFDSPRFPRLNRIVLYLGYVLLTLNITHWFTVTHNVEQQVLNSDLTQSGLRIFGLTAAYLVFVEGGRALFKRED